MSALNNAAALADDVESRADELFNDLSADELCELIGEIDAPEYCKLMAALCEFAVNQNPANSVAKQNALLAAVQQSVRPEMLKRAGGV